MMFFLLWGPLLLLGAVCVLTLNMLPSQRRRGLFTLFFIMLGLAVVLFGGAWVLERNGLAWRAWFQEGMSGTLWVVGLVTGVLTVLYGRRWLPERCQTAGRIVVYLSAFCLCTAMFAGSVVGALWCMGPGETVGTYQGKKVVQGNWTWMETSYDLYEYYGLLVRGKNPITWGEEPLLDGAVIDAG